MSGRRIQPQPGQYPPITEITDPNLAQPLNPMGSAVGSPPMMSNPQFAAVSAQQMAHQMSQQDMAGIPLGPGGRPAGPQPGMPGMAAPPPIPGFEGKMGEPFAKLHGNAGPVMIGEDGEPVSFAPPAPEQINELSVDERAQFAMLMHIGKRSKTITVYGHPVVIENLNVADDLRIGLYCKDYIGAPVADVRARHIGVCAAGIKAIDARPLYTPMTMEESEEEIFRKKVGKIEQFYPATVTEIYRAIMALDQEFAELSEKLKNRTG